MRDALKHIILAILIVGSVVACVYFYRLNVKNGNIPNTFRISNSVTPEEQARANMLKNIELGAVPPPTDAQMAAMRSRIKK